MIYRMKEPYEVGYASHYSETYGNKTVNNDIKIFGN